MFLDAGDRLVLFCMACRTVDSPQSDPCSDVFFVGQSGQCFAEHGVAMDVAAPLTEQRVLCSNPSSTPDTRLLHP